MKNKNYLVYGFLAVIIVSALVLFYVAKANKVGRQNVSQVSKEDNPHAQRLTKFDAKLAKELMDEDNNSQCDACGMGVKACIDSGQLECNMAQNAKIDILGTQAVHADWTIYIDGKALDASFFKTQGLKSSFNHVERTQKYSGKLGDIL